MDSAKDGGGADAPSNAGEAAVDEAQNVAAVGRRLRHNARLRPAVHKCLHLHSVDLRTGNDNIMRGYIP